MLIPPFQGNALALGSADYTSLRDKISPLDRTQLISILAGMLTIPKYLPESIRIEFLIHLTMFSANGGRHATEDTVRELLVDGLGRMEIKHVEDPPEDVFISNIITPSGNYRLFEGTWESSDHYLQQLLDAVFHKTQTPQNIIRSAIALLYVTEFLACRSDLHRWHEPADRFPEINFLQSDFDASELQSRAVIKRSALESAGVSIEALEPFIFDTDRSQILESESWGHSSLERRPLLLDGDDILVALPTAISISLRRWLVEVFRDLGGLPLLGTAIAETDRELLFNEILGSMAIGNNTYQAELPELIAPEDTAIGNLTLAVLPMDTDKVCVVVLLEDQWLADLPLTGLSGIMTPRGKFMQVLAQYLHTEIWRISKACSGGLLLAVWGGLGRAHPIIMPTTPQGWNCCVISLPSLEQVARLSEMSTLRIWKMVRRLDDLSKKNIEVVSVGGIENLIAFWRYSGYDFLGDEIPHAGPVVLNPPTNCIYDLRLHCRTIWDRHAAEYTPGNWVTVQRLHPHSYFTKQRTLPIYACPEAASSGSLLGLVEHGELVWWIVFRDAGVRIHSDYRELFFNIWQALLEWCTELIPQLEGDLDSRLIVELHPSFEPSWTEPASKEWGPPAVPMARRDSQGQIHLTIPFGYIALLNRPDNDGERELLIALTAVLKSDASKALCDEIVGKCLQGTGKRHIHLFESHWSVDHIDPPGPPRPRFLQPENTQTAAVGIVGRLSTDPPPRVVEDPNSSKELLNLVVDALWLEIKELLQSTSRHELIQMIVLNNESLHLDRTHWTRTARAVAALYADEAVHTAARRESERSLAAQAGRILIEMIMGTPSNRKVKDPSWAVFDELLAKTALLLQFAWHSDSIHKGGLTPSVEITPSGRIDIGREFLDETAIPYLLRSFSTEFEGAAGRYKVKFGDSDSNGQEPIFSTEMCSAFSAEYGYEPETLFEMCRGLMQLAEELNTLAPTVSASVYVERLVGAQALERRVVDSFLEDFTLQERARWDSAPVGYEDRDWWPWRYRRRLSLVARPLILVKEGSGKGSRITFGVNQLAASVSYLLEGIQEGWFQSQYFNSTDMRSFIGATAKARGQGFTSEVATKMKEQGLETWIEKSAVSLGGPEVLGDFDVIAWRQTDGELMLIECKRLAPARTLGEIVERLNEFKGDAKDRLDRHVRRVEWARDSIDNLKRELGIQRIKSIRPLLVTNRVVPMQFRSGLPIDSEYIIPFEEL